MSLVDAIPNDAHLTSRAAADPSLVQLGCPTAASPNGRWDLPLDSAEAEPDHERQRGLARDSATAAPPRPRWPGIDGFVTTGQRSATSCIVLLAKPASPTPAASHRARPSCRASTVWYHGVGRTDRPDQPQTLLDIAAQLHPLEDWDLRTVLRLGPAAKPARVAVPNLAAPAPTTVHVRDERATRILLGLRQPTTTSRSVSQLAKPRPSSTWSTQTMGHDLVRLFLRRRRRRPSNPGQSARTRHRVLHRQGRLRTPVAITTPTSNDAATPISHNAISWDKTRRTSLDDSRTQRRPFSTSSSPRDSDSRVLVDDAHSLAWLTFEPVHGERPHS